MHHKCVKCGKVYAHASEEILNGCSCGSKLFYFVKSNTSEKKKNAESVDYFYELEDDTNGEITIFDIEAVQIESSGKYKLDIDGLMKANSLKNAGLVYKYGEGKYGIDLDNNLKQLKKRR